MLPPDSTYSLLGQPKAKPGDPLAGERQALVLRLSRQALDALDVQPAPTVEVDFDTQPGLYINGAFFPFSSQPEPVRHELYSRNANKPHHLKSSATISGKLTVEPVLDTQLTDRVQQSTLAAHNEKHGRGTKFIDTPPVIAPTKQAKKKAQPLPNSMFMKSTPSRPSDLPPRPQPSSSTSAPPPPQPPPNAERIANLASAKGRLIRFFAKKERTIEEALSAVVPNTDASYKQQVRNMITNEICEPVATAKKTSAPSLYRLRKEMYLEVRPYEWSGVPEKDRHAIARAGRRALSEMGYKESDPAWKYVAFTAPDQAPQALSTASSSSSTAKRPTSAIEAKEKKPKPETKPKTKTTALKEEAHASPIPSPIRSSSSTSARKPPGSGFKLPKNEDPGSGRVKSERESPELSRHASSSRDRATAQRVTKLKESAGSDIERNKPKRESGSDRESVREGTLKRKKVVKDEEDDDEPLSKQKRRKTAEGMHVSDRRDGPSHARVKAIKEESPAPPPVAGLPKKPPRPSASPQLYSKTSSSKVADVRARRRDFTNYTSSEDEGDSPPSTNRHSPPPLPSPPTTIASSGSASSRTKRSIVPRDGHSQRRQYRKLWGKYLNIHGRLVAHRARVAELLNDIEDSHSSVTVSDDDGDVRLMDEDELERALAEHDGYQSELEKLEKAIKNGS